MVKYEHVLVGRQKCGCVGLVTLETPEDSQRMDSEKRRMEERGYVVSIVPFSEAPTRVECDKHLGSAWFVANARDREIYLATEKFRNQ